MAEEFSYDYSKPNGPDHWSEIFPLSQGLNQSPININDCDAIYHLELLTNPLTISYYSCDSIKNTGHSFQIYFDKNKHSVVTGGPVTDTYTFLQMHMHWGDDHNGSEHKLNGKYYPAEIHFVNWNSSKYNTPEEAMQPDNPDGFLVLGVFAVVGKENPELHKITKHFQHIHHKGEKDSLDEIIHWANLFPIRKTNSQFFSGNFIITVLIKPKFKDSLSKFYTYHGSLTTPPFSECVRWVVFKDPIEVSEEQLEALRQLSVAEEKEIQMMCNHRDTCQLNKRRAFKSFQ